MSSVNQLVHINLFVLSTKNDLWTGIIAITGENGGEPNEGKLGEALLGLY
jgi:hypothetical protein